MSKSRSSCTRVLLGLQNQNEPFDHTCSHVITCTHTWTMSWTAWSTMHGPHLTWWTMPQWWTSHACGPVCQRAARLRTMHLQACTCGSACHGPFHLGPSYYRLNLRCQNLIAIHYSWSPSRSKPSGCSVDYRWQIASVESGTMIMRWSFGSMSPCGSSRSLWTPSSSIIIPRLVLLYFVSLLLLHKSSLWWASM